MGLGSIQISSAERPELAVVVARPIFFSPHVRLSTLKKSLVFYDGGMHSAPAAVAHRSQPPNFQLQRQRQNSSQSNLNVMTI
jgi:hypothetical protein